MKYKNQLKMVKGNRIIFGDLQWDYINGKRIHKNSYTNTKNSVKKNKKKIMHLETKEFSRAFNMMKENQKFSVVRNLFMQLRPDYAKKLSDEYGDYEEKKEENLKKIEGWNEPKKLERAKSAYEEGTLERCKISVEMESPVQDKDYTSRKINEILREKEIVLCGKIEADRQYISSSELNRGVYRRLIKQKLPKKFSDIESGFEKEKEKDVAREFFRRGILVEKNLEQNQVIKKIENLIDKGHYKKNMKSQLLGYEMYPFKVNGVSYDKEVVICDFFKDLDMEYYASF